MGSLPTHSKPSKSIPMRKLTTTICLTFAVLLGSVGCQTTSPVSYSGSYGGKLPPCAGNPNQVTWSLCSGSVENNGHKYEGEWKDGVPHGNGNLTRSDEEIYIGQFRNGKRDGEGTCKFPSINKGKEFVCLFIEGNIMGMDPSS